jgi:signal transduction histidine kinase/HPt (histidine-containing phosphotransfer) domain-containing protein/AmiR/NasT family two-component response regulator
MKEFRARSINRKLSRLVVLAIGSAMLFVASLGLWQEATLYLNSKRDTLLATASAFAAASGEAVAIRDERAAYLAIRGIASIPAIQFASLEDNLGRSIANIGSGVRLAGDLDLSDKDRETTPLGLLSTGTVSVAVEVKKEGRAIGRLKLIGDVSDLWRRLTSVFVVDALGALGALAIGLGISLKLQRSITRPLITLTHVMASIQASHDYGAQVAIDSDDEIGLLAVSFNSMIGEVQERDRRLIAHRDRLEHDVAERTHDLALAKDEAEAANVAKSDFLATMSHEIRTPMNGMLVMAELLAGSNLPERQRRYAEVIARSGQSLLAIINDILDFSKIEAGKLDLEEISFALPDVIDTVVTLFAERASSKGLDLAAYVAHDVPEVITGDPVRLTQVMSNLVNNALKFTEKGHVLVSVNCTDGQLRLCVSDTGIGIPPDKISTIFAAFSQADQSTTRRFGGTGLGLSICKRIVDAMHGTVDVDSTEQHGSTFSVMLPLPAAPPQALERPKPSRPVAVRLAGDATLRSATRSLASAGFDMVAAVSTDPHDLVVDTRDLLAGTLPKAVGRVVGVAAIGDPSGAEALRLGLADVLLRRPIVQAEWRDVIARLGAGLPFAPEVSAAAPQPEPLAAGTLRGIHVLVADDSAVNREVACEALARLDVSAEAVDGGYMALEAIRSRRFDLVLMDGSMPDLDGYETTCILRQEEARTGGPHLPVVALTAHVVGAAADKWREAGMDDVLHKPFTVAKLADVLHRTLGPARLGLERGSKLHQEVPESESDVADNASDLLDGDTLAGIEDLAEFGGGGEFLNRILRMFAEGVPPAFSELREAAARKDAGAVTSAAHKLKSMSLNVGALRLAMRLARIESRALDNKLVPNRECIDQAELCFAETNAALQFRASQPRTGVVAA